MDAIHDGALAEAQVERDARFGFDVVAECPGVPAAVLVPRQTWADGAAYDEKAGQLAELFKKNFAKYEKGTSDAIKRAGPA